MIGECDWWWNGVVTKFAKISSFVLNSFSVEDV